MSTEITRYLQQCRQARFSLLVKDNNNNKTKTNKLGFIREGERGAGISLLLVQSQPLSQEFENRKLCSYC